MLPFIPNSIYRRSDIHDQYKLNRQSGISYSAKSPYIFIFSGATGKQYGYQDGWDNPNIYSYTGEGQTGNMKFTKGNLALANHLQDGKRVFLFEYQRKGIVTFISELEFFDVEPSEILDTKGKLREGIKFFFKRKDAKLPAYAVEQLSIVGVNDDKPDYRMDIPTEKQSLVTTRVGQGAFRKRIIHRWEYKCAVTGFHHQQVLIASHIVPWKSAEDHERLDVSNGILLSPTYDALFDRHLISFENSGKIILSTKIELEAFKKVGITGTEKVIKFNSDNYGYLEKHRNEIVTL